MTCQFTPLLFLSWTSNRLRGEAFLPPGSLPRSALDPALLPLFFPQQLQSFVPKHGLPVPCCILPKVLSLQLR